MAILSLHHWDEDQESGAREMRRHDPSVTVRRDHRVGQALENRGRRDQQVCQPVLPAGAGVLLAGAPRVSHVFLGVHDLAFQRTTAI